MQHYNLSNTSRFCWVTVIGDDCVHGGYGTKATDEAVVEILFRMFLSLGRTPAELQSDNGSQFTSACVK